MTMYSPPTIGALKYEIIDENTNTNNIMHTSINRRTNESESNNTTNNFNTYVIQDLHEDNNNNNNLQNGNNNFNESSNSNNNEVDPIDHVSNFVYNHHNNTHHHHHLSNSLTNNNQNDIENSQNQNVYSYYNDYNDYENRRYNNDYDDYKEQSYNNNDSIIPTTITPQQILYPNSENILETSLNDGTNDPGLAGYGKRMGRRKKSSIQSDCFDSLDFANSQDLIMTKEEAELLTKLNAKERRQLRNKISARNFRIRRKEYISSLEQKVESHENETKRMKEEIKDKGLEILRLKNEVLRLTKLINDESNANSTATTNAIVFKSSSNNGQSQPDLMRSSRNSDYMLSHKTNPSTPNIARNYQDDETPRIPSTYHHLNNIGTVSSNTASTNHEKIGRRGCGSTQQ